MFDNADVMRDFGMKRAEFEALRGTDMNGLELRRMPRSRLRREMRREVIRIGGECDDEGLQGAALLAERSAGTD